MQSGAQTVLFVGDLSYADRYKFNDVGVRWDSWGRFVECSAAYQPWIWTAGNHEIDYFPEMVFLKFKSGIFYAFFIYFLHLHVQFAHSMCMYELELFHYVTKFLFIYLYILAYVWYSIFHIDEEKLS